MTELASGQISKDEGLFPALKAAAEQSGSGHCVLRLESKGLSGKVGISDGKFITGARVPACQESGVAALRRLFGAREGSFSFGVSSIDDLAELDQGLSIRLQALFDKSPEAIHEARPRTADATDEEVVLATILSTEDSYHLLIARLKETSHDQPEDDLDPEGGDHEGGDHEGDGSGLVHGDTGDGAGEEHEDAASGVTGAQTRKAKRLKKLKTTTMRIEALSPVSPTAPPDQPKIESSEKRAKRTIGQSLGLVTLGVLIATGWLAYNHMRLLDSKRHLADALNFTQSKMYDKALKELELAIREDPSEPAALVARGNLRLKTGKPELALEDFAAALKLSGGDNQFAATGRGVAYLETGKVEQGLTDLAAAIDRSPEQSEPYRALGAYYMQRKDFKKGLEYYRLLTEKALNQATASDFESLAGCLLKVGQLEQAAYAFGRAAALEPASERFLIAKADCYEKLGRTDALIHTLKSAIDCNPADINNYVELGSIYLREKKYELAISVFGDGIAQNTRRKDLYMKRAQCSIALKQWGSALADLDAVLKIDPDDQEAKSERTLAKREAGKTRTAVGDKAIEPAPLVTVDLKMYQDLVKTDEPRVAQAGVDLVRSGNVDDGIALLYIAVKQNPDDTRARLALAAALVDVGLVHRALMEYKVLAAVGQLHGEDLVAYGKALAAADRVGESVRVLLDCISRGEDADDAHVALVQIYEGAGMVDQAIALCKDGIARARSQITREKLTEMMNSLESGKALPQQPADGSNQKLSPSGT